MRQRIKNKYLILSTLCSVISISATIVINNQIAQEYIKSDGKTRALFGIKEWLQFGYQYCVLAMGSVAFFLAILGIKENNQRSKKITVILLSLLAITIVFVKIWRVFI